MEFVLALFINPRGVSGNIDRSVYMITTGEGAAAFVGLTCASALFLGRWKDSDSLTLHALSHILQIDSVRNGVIPSATLAEPETRLRTLTLLKTSMPEVWHCFKLHKH